MGKYRMTFTVYPLYHIIFKGKITVELFKKPCLRIVRQLEILADVKPGINLISIEC